MTAFSMYVDQVRDQARGYDPRRAALTVVALLPFLLGWLVGIVFQTLWVVVAWAWAAGAVGFRSAREVGPGS